MMFRRRQQFRVGVFVASSVATFAALLLFIMGRALESETVPYQMLFAENVKGMVVGSKVNYMGIPVGSVSDIRFRQGQTLVTIEIDPQKAPIQPSTTASLDRLLVTGQVTVELEGYDESGRFLPPGSMIHVVADPMAEFTANMPAIADQAEHLLGEGAVFLSHLNEIFESEQPRIRRILANVEAASSELPAAARAWLDETRKSAEALRPVAAQAEATLKRFEDSAVAAEDLMRDPELRATIEAARQAVEGLNAVEASALGLSEDLRQLFGNAQHPVYDALLSLRDSLHEFEELARTLRHAPSALVFGADAGEIQVPSTTAAPNRED